MKSKIVNYLTVKIMSDKNFHPHYAQRVRVAWILAEKQYKKLTKEEKQEIIEELSGQ